MPAPKKDAAPAKDAPRTSVFYVTLDGARVARSATEGDARRYIEELVSDGVARVRASHNMPAEGPSVLDVELGADGEVY